MKFRYTVEEGSNKCFSWPIAVYIIIMSIITVVSAYLAGETRTAAVIAAEAAAGVD